MDARNAGGKTVVRVRVSTSRPTWKARVHNLPIAVNPPFQGAETRCAVQRVALRQTTSAKVWLQ